MDEFEIGAPLIEADLHYGRVNPDISVGEAEALDHFRSTDAWELHYETCDAESGDFPIPILWHPEMS
ncbi:hypothetical protein [Treponema sp. R6D11]